MKFATYLLPFFLAVSSSLAKDSTHRNRKLGPLVAAGGNTKTSKTSADSDGECIFGLLTRQKIVGGLVGSLYAHAAPEYGAGFSLSDRNLYLMSYPQFEKGFVKMGLAIGLAYDEDVHWPHATIWGYFQELADTHYPDTDRLVQQYGLVGQSGPFWYA